MTTMHEGTIGLLLGLAILVGGCEEPARHPQSSARDAEGRGLPLLYGSVLATGDWLAAPAVLAYHDGVLYVGEAFTEPYIHEVDPLDGHLVASWGRQGDGPGEFKTISSFTSNGDSLWVFDFNSRRMTLVEPRQSGSEARVINFTTDYSFSEPTWVGDSLLLATSYSPRGRLVVFDSAGREQRLQGVPPTLEGLPSQLQPYATQSVLSIRPAGDLVVLAGRWSSRVDIASLNGTILDSAASPVKVLPVFEAVEGSRGPILGHTLDTRSGYVGLVASDSLIVALFSGRRLGDYSSMGAGHGRLVQIFDWHGKLISRVLLDKDLTAFTIDWRGQVMYGVGIEPVPRIFSFDLAQVFSGN